MYAACNAIAGIKTLKGKVRDLDAANEILKQVLSIDVRELDPRT